MGKCLGRTCVLNIYADPAAILGFSLSNRLCYMDYTYSTCVGIYITDTAAILETVGFVPQPLCACTVLYVLYVVRICSIYYSN